MPAEHISVIIPVRNEAASIDALAAALRSQTRPPDEIIIVDGGSEDDTRERVRARVKEDSRWRLVSTGPATPGRGRNVGARSATHEWIAFTDAGAWPHAAWLEALGRVAEDHPNCTVVFGNYEPVTDTFFARCASLTYVPAKHRCRGGAVRGPSTASMLIRRDVMDAVGGFPDLRAGEDLLFFDALLAQGHEAAWAPDATVYWQLQPTVAGTFRRFRTYSRANVDAGLASRWHHGVVRYYGVLAGILALGAGHDRRWLWAVPALFGARALRSIWTRGGPARWRALLNPVVLAAVMAIILVIDAATFAGWWDARAAEARARRQPEAE